MDLKETMKKKRNSPQVHTVSFVKNIAPQKSISLDFTLEHETAVRHKSPEKNTLCWSNNIMCAQSVHQDNIHQLW